MKYLYIPTTTLNFNNILSTGSISPAAVYSSRGFGYKQFECIDPNPHENILLLYDRCPVFTIEDSERDSHPLILRVREDRLPCVLSKQTSYKGDVTIYICDETIYLDPSSTDFIFLTPEAKNVACTKAEPSLTTKLLEIYQPRIRIYALGKADMFEWSSAIVESVKNGALKCCEADNCINRLKGFAYGYVLGAYMSIPGKVATTKSKLREVTNEMSAILNDPYLMYTDHDRQDVESAFLIVNQKFEKATGKMRFDPDKGDDITIDQGNISEVREHHQSAAQPIKSIIHLINAYCLTSKFSGQLDEERMDIALAGAKAIKGIIGSQWEGSEYKKYINDLLNNIKSGDDFDFNELDNIAIQSFAAFVLKGDDLVRLESFLASNDIGDFRLAFALWGAMFGFSKIPKTVFNLPFAYGDEDYAKRMHLYVHSVVHGIPLTELEKPSLDEADPGVSQPSHSGDSHTQILNQLTEELPGVDKWVPKLWELLNKHSGFTEDFVNEVKERKTTIAVLGGRIKGVKKNKVVRFFKEALRSQPQDHLAQSTLPLKPEQDLKFWEDNSALTVIKRNAPHELHKRLEEQLKWFRKEWTNPNSAHYGKESISDFNHTPIEQRTNTQAIDRFCKSFKNYSKKKYLLLSQDDLDKLKRSLESHYRVS